MEYLSGKSFSEHIVRGRSYLSAGADQCGGRIVLSVFCASCVIQSFVGAVC